MAVPTLLPASDHSASECISKLYTGDIAGSSETGAFALNLERSGFSHQQRIWPAFIIPSTTPQWCLCGAVRNDLPLTAANTS